VISDTHEEERQEKQREGRREKGEGERIAWAMRVIIILVKSLDSKNDVDNALHLSH
jgi:hypothetical protein